MSQSDPHSDDFCVVCEKGVRVGVTMHPLVNRENACVCGKCFNFEGGDE